MIALDDKNAHKAMLIAHPDDECVWAGGLLMRHTTNWTIICASTPRKDPIRAFKFKHICLLLGVNYKIYPKIEYLDTVFDHLDEIKLSQYDLVLTHNSVGEYGHAHHIACHNHVVDNFAGDKYFFGYGLSRDVAEFMVYLDDNEYRNKINLIKCYDHKYGDSQKPLWQFLLDDFDGRFDLRREYFVV